MVDVSWTCKTLLICGIVTGKGDSVLTLPLESTLIGCWAPTAEVARPDVDLKGRYGPAKHVSAVRHTTYRRRER